ncbi:MAG TPA: hypothetical protein VNW51_08815 [Mucilaginibacter sp.]|jgi:hypothetical protein|nr:hypothetical protein [Mucilaginibacter sp.]
MKKFLLLILVIAFGCKNKASQPAVHISLIDSNRSLKITGIDSIILNDIDRDTAKNWQSLFAISRMPADTDLKDYQPTQPGKYCVSKGSVIFTPDTPFVKQQPYFLRYYIHGSNKDIWDYARNRAKPGALRYTDLIFKP